MTCEINVELNDKNYVFTCICVHTLMSTSEYTLYVATVDIYFTDSMATNQVMLQFCYFIHKGNLYYYLFMRHSKADFSHNCFASDFLVLGVCNVWKFSTDSCHVVFTLDLDYAVNLTLTSQRLVNNK